jgi:hypothetical protein
MLLRVSLWPNMSACPDKTPGGARRGLVRGSSKLPIVAVIAVVALAAVATFFLQRGKTPKPASDAPPAANSISAAAPADAAAKADFQFLKGRWVRPDGNYVLEIRAIDATGQMDAGYYNPQPIHVAKAEVKKEGAATKVFIELNDVSYPGCKYNLTYIPGEEQLVGTYYQAAMQETYEIGFVRLKE